MDLSLLFFHYGSSFLNIGTTNQLVEIQSVNRTPNIVSTWPILLEVQGMSPIFYTPVLNYCNSWMIYGWLDVHGHPAQTIPCSMADILGCLAPISNLDPQTVGRDTTLRGTKWQGAHDCL